MEMQSALQTLALWLALPSRVAGSRDPWLCFTDAETEAEK